MHKNKVDFDKWIKGWLDGKTCDKVNTAECKLSVLDDGYRDVTIQFSQLFCILEDLHNEILGKSLLKWIRKYTLLLRTVNEAH